MGIQRDTPYDHMSIDEIVNLPEAEYRHYQVHMNERMITVVNNLCTTIKKRPENKKATIALVISGTTAVCAILGTLWMVLT